MAAWCRERNINIHQMYYWKRRFDQLLEAKTASTDWFDVSQSNSLNEGASIMIRVNNLSVEVNPQVDRQLLFDVLYLLKYE
ncbi:hypothetical protein [Paraliobacillus sp. PM-2]|uniref:IS66 family insertion sequence element accessory protein TnpA n=1 Tax=Paraliobacillus sp. PM-2 TaxID=1462524 RepID=UPI000A90CEA8|nr:hypothetical protein [Paraliobacillus sp. PM-2]